MVKGMDKFREHFTGYEDQYAIIGGAACELLFGEAGLDFRATKDIDMVLCVEVVDAAFGERFAAFLEAGGYKARERADGKKEFYRFHKPTDTSFPHMIELFSRKPDALKLPEGVVATRIPADGQAISLSAILLDDDYYAALQSGKRDLDGVTIANETLLIPFKARAYLNLCDDGKGDKEDTRKHRNDVFRLLQLLPNDAALDVSEPIRADLRRFSDTVEKDQAFDPQSFKVPISREDGIAQLRSAYKL
jgi:hypothetical protein